MFITVVDLTWRIDLKRLEKLAGKCVLRIPLRDFVLIVHFMEPQAYVVESTTDAHGRILCTKLITVHMWLWLWLIVFLSQIDKVAIWSEGHKVWTLLFFGFKKAIKTVLNNRIKYVFCLYKYVNFSF